MGTRGGAGGGGRGINKSCLAAVRGFKGFQSTISERKRKNIRNLWPASRCRHEAKTCPEVAGDEDATVLVRGFRQLTKERAGEKTTTTGNHTE